MVAYNAVIPKRYLNSYFYNKMKDPKKSTSCYVDEFENL